MEEEGLFSLADFVNSSGSPWDNSSLEGNGSATFVHESELNLLPIAAYSVMFVVAACGNLTVLVTLLRIRRKTRILLLLTHLTVADLIVTFFMIPMEVMWRVTNQWRAGNLLCKVFMVVRAFGPYLSSNVLVCITLDRFFVILYPLRIGQATRRGKMTLSVAWAFSFVCALPQSVIFKVMQHPMDPNFHQCVTFDSFFNQTQEMLYNLFCIAAVYFIPLFIIVFSYTCILYEIMTKSKEDKEGAETGRLNSGRVRLRKSDMSTIERAKARTLKMSITIVLTFLWCWTPYVVMTLWYMFDRDSAQTVDRQLQEILFLMAVSNSCLNPLVYGSYALNLRKTCCGRPIFNASYLRRRSTSTKTNATFEEGTPTGPVSLLTSLSYRQTSRQSSAEGLR